MARSVPQASLRKPPRVRRQRAAKPADGPASEPAPRRPRPLDAAGLRRHAAAVPRWDVDEERVAREWTFSGFGAAMASVQRVAEAAERLDHHPDIHVTGARSVRLECATHSAGGVTAKDFALAAAIDAIPAAHTRPAGQRSSTDKA